MTMPSFADQAQILRCVQRDRDCIKQIQNDINEILCDILPSRSKGFSRLRAYHPTIAQLFYYYYTTLSKYQTLGEEYVGVVLSRANLSTPSRFNLLCMVMLRIFGPHMMPYILKVWESTLKGENASRSEEDVLESAKRMLFMKEAVSVLDTVRNGLFYLTGSLYDIAMLVTGIHYVLIRPWFRNEKIFSFFKVLGVLSLIYAFVNAVDKWKKIQNVCNEDLKTAEITSGNNSSGSYCYLCMEKRKNSSATPCGHLFCWNCIVEAVRVKNVCPLCRERVIPSRIVLIKNYD